MRVSGVGGFLASMRESAMTHALVPSNRVESAAVYGRDGQKVGAIERLMLDKKTGIVAYAVVRSGGFLKADVHHYPLPWDSLKYNVVREAYETNLTLEELRRGPSELDGEAFDWGDRSPAYRHPQYWTV
jgi:sporulation protein YlmC with PRC-barrel domain